MKFKVKSVSKAELGQLRPPSQADIERQSAVAARSPAQQKAHTQAMARIPQSSHAVCRYETAGKEVTGAAAAIKSRYAAGAGQTPVRHHSVTRVGYGDPVAQNTKGMLRNPRACRHPAQHPITIQCNVQREAQRERFRQVGQQAKAKVAGMVQQVGRAARSIVPPSLGQAQSELVGKQKMQSMNQHREQVRDKAKGKETGREKRQFALG